VGFFRQLLKHDTKGEFLFARLRQLNGKLAGDTRFNEDAGRRDECRRGGDEHILAEGVLVPFFYVRFQMDDAITGVNYRQRCKGASTRLDRHRQDVATICGPKSGLPFTFALGAAPGPAGLGYAYLTQVAFISPPRAVVRMLLMGRIDTLQLGSPVTKIGPCCQYVSESACAFSDTVVQMFISKRRSAKREPHR